MLTNLHEGKEAWLGSLRNSIIVIFELADVGRTKGYIDLNPTEFFATDYISISEVRHHLKEVGIKTGEDLNRQLKEWEKDGLDDEDIEYALYYFIAVDDEDDYDYPEDD